MAQRFHNKMGESLSMKVLNLYSGLGGNRKHWKNCEVTSVEENQEIADVYKELFPGDNLVIGDAHTYLQDHYLEFDFIWSSPPCQTHSKMAQANARTKNPNLKLYEEILFLKHFFKGKWVVENVCPFYEPLIKETTKVGRHMFWASDYFIAEDVKRPKDFINLDNLKGKEKLMNWLGIHYEKNIYYKGNHCPCQILRNCVHPDLGLQIFNQLKSV